MVLFFTIAIPQISAKTQEVYVVPIKGEVGPAMEEFVSQSIGEAEESNAVAIIFEIDTPGGRVDSAINISEAILNTPLQTIAYVKDEAISAGTLITVSAEDIYMSPSSTIGAAETRPNEEKYISYWTGKLRNMAEIRGRDPQLLAAMADADIEIEGVIQKGKILTLTAGEAMDLKLIDGVEDSIEDVQGASDLENCLLKELQPSFQLRLASLATSTTATSILLTIGFVGVIIEIFTAGFGIGGIISLLAFGLYFGGVLLAGFSSWVVIVIFIVGIILLMVEVFAPGFGIPGILGIASMITSIIMASASVEQAVISLLVSFVLTIVAIILLIKFGPKKMIFNRITLSTSLNEESGYRSTEDYKEYIGKEGIAITTLRPSGSIEVEGKRLDAVSESVYIEKNTPIKITQVEGSRIIVRKID